MMEYIPKAILLSHLETLGNEGRFLAANFRYLLKEGSDPLIPFVGKPGYAGDFAVYHGHPPYEHFKPEHRAQMMMYNLDSFDRVLAVGDKVSSELGCALFPELAEDREYRR